MSQSPRPSRGGRHAGAAGSAPSGQSSISSSTTTERRGLLFVAIAVLFFSTSPVLVRWAAATLTSYEIVFWRLLIAGVVVGGLALVLRQPWPRLGEWPRFVLFGLIAALHFAFYVASLSYTTIAHSLALIYTAPIFVAVLSWLFLDERLRRRQWFGIVLAVMGVAVLAGFEPMLTQRMLFGDLLAVGSAIAFGFYSVAGRSQRNHFPLFVYAGAVYTLGALWLLPAAWINRSPAGYTVPAILSLLALGLLPLALGHTLYNAAVRLTTATKVNLVATQEVTGGILLGILFLQEMPSVSTLIGALITMAGIVLVIL